MNSISIIIPVYNVEQYIHRCLESIAHKRPEYFHATTALWAYLSAILE